MIKITYSDIRQGLFIPSFDRLCNNPNLPQKVSYNIAKMASKIRPAVEKSQDEFFALVKKYAHQDEKGNITPDPKRGPGSFTIKDEHTETYKKELEAFDAQFVEIDRLKLTLKDLEKASLAPNEWLGLEPIITEQEEALPAPTPINKNASA